VESLRAIATGSTYEAVTAEDVGDIRVNDLALSEQSSIADYLDRETARIDSLIAAQRRLISLLEERRQALVSAVVEGKAFGGSDA